MLVHCATNRKRGSWGETSFHPPRYSSWNQKKPTAPGPACADDRAESRGELDLGLRPKSPHELAQRPHPLGSVRVRDRDAQSRPILGRLGEAALELGDCLPPPPYARDGDDLAVLNAQDRAHVQERPGESRGPPDSPTSLQVLERLDGEDDLALAVEALDERCDLDVGRPAGETALDRVGEHRDRERRGPRVDDPDSVSAELGRGELCGLNRPRDLRGDVQRVDALESPRGSRRRRGSPGASAGRSRGAPETCAVSSRSRPGRARRSRGTCRRRSARTKGRSACSGTATAPRGSRRSSRGRPPCSRWSDSSSTPSGRRRAHRADEYVDPLVLAHERDSFVRAASSSSLTRRGAQEDDRGIRGTVTNLVRSSRAVDVRKPVVDHDDVGPNSAEADAAAPPIATAPTTSIPGARPSRIESRDRRPSPPRAAHGSRRPRSLGDDEERVVRLPPMEEG